MFHIAQRGSTVTRELIGGASTFMALSYIIFVNPVISPAVPEGRQLLRTSYMATHTDQQLDQVVETLSKIGKKVGLI